MRLFEGIAEAFYIIVTYFITYFINFKTFEGKKVFGNLHTVFRNIIGKRNTHMLLENGNQVRLAYLQLVRNILKMELGGIARLNYINCIKHNMVAGMMGSNIKRYKRIRCF